LFSINHCRYIASCYVRYVVSNLSNVAFASLWAGMPCWIISFLAVRASYSFSMWRSSLTKEYMYKLQTWWKMTASVCVCMYACVNVQSSVYSLVVQCQRRLDYIMKSGAKRGLKLPTVDEITQSLVSCMLLTNLFCHLYSRFVSVFHRVFLGVVFILSIEHWRWPLDKASFPVATRVQLVYKARALM